MERCIFSYWLVNIIPIKKAGLKSGFLLEYHNSVVCPSSAGHPSKALSPI